LPVTLHEKALTIEDVQRYAWRAVRCHYRLRDPDDIVQQICLEWLEHAKTTDPTYHDLRGIVSRVIGRAYTQHGKQQRTRELSDQPAPADALQRELKDIQIDRDLGLRDLTDQEWQILELKRQGFTFEEIGSETGMRKQRAHEMYMAAVSYLQERYNP
jgi:DNA-directed RNA polymerase specialized sigma24 family protein